MSPPPGHEPIADDEILYRRIPVSKGWCDEYGVSPEAFAPHPKFDSTGLSVFRSNYKSVEEAAKGPSKSGYYVAELKASDLRNAGIDIVPKPLENDPGHAELPDLRSDNRKDAEILERMDHLRVLVREVHGPFLSPT